MTEPSASATLSDSPSPKPDPKPTKSPADPIATIVSLVLLICSAAQLPSKLGISTQVLVSFGGLVVLIAAIARGVIELRKGGSFPLQDKIAAAIGLLTGLVAAAGGPIIALDPDLVATLASALATSFAMRRTVKGTPTKAEGA